VEFCERRKSAYGNSTASNRFLVLIMAGREGGRQTATPGDPKRPHYGTFTSRNVGALLGSAGSGSAPVHFPTGRSGNECTRKPPQACGSDKPRNWP
jgi:hypothetical protein